MGVHVLNEKELEELKIAMLQPKADEKLTMCAKTVIVAVEHASYWPPEGQKWMKEGLKSACRFLHQRENNRPRRSRHIGKVGLCIL